MLSRDRSRPIRLRLEVEILQTIGSHPGIVELLDVFKLKRYVVLILELASGEDICR